MTHEDNMKAGEVDAGSVAPGLRWFLVTEPHGHDKLQVGDVVLVVEDPRACNWIFRIKDMTLHSLTGKFGQYVHLKPITP